MKGKKLPKIVLIGILTLVTAFVWVASDLLRNFSKKPETKVPEEILEPVNPSLDQETLGKIESALFFDASQIPTLPSPSPSQEPEPTPTPEPSPSPTPEPSSTASPTASPTT